MTSVALDAARRIEKTASLADGWNYGRGVASSAAARAGASLSAALLAYVGVDAIAIFPDTDGGVMVTGYRGKSSFEIFTNANGRGDAMFEDDNGEGPITTFDGFDELQALLGEKGWRESNTSASFLRHITTFASSDTPALPSRIQATTVVYPLSTWSAQSQPLATYAGTSRVFTQGDYQDRPQLSGGFTRLKSSQWADSSRATPLLEITATTI